MKFIDWNLRTGEGLETGAWGYLRGTLGTGISQTEFQGVSVWWKKTAVSLNVFAKY